MWHTQKGTNATLNCNKLKALFYFLFVWARGSRLQQSKKTPQKNEKQRAHIHNRTNSKNKLSFSTIDFQVENTSI